jgi:excisionase family DNA binding protein
MFDLQGVQNTPMEVTMPKEVRGATYYNVSELADKLGVHRNTILNWIKDGQIEASRIGLAKKSPYLIEEKEAERVMKELSLQ